MSIKTFELMDPYRFSPSGNRELDMQQLDFLEKGNSYLKAYNRGRHEQVVEQAIVMLSDYTRHHFASQEAFMAEYQYPGADKHTSHHKEYLLEVAKAFKALLAYKQNKDINILNNLCISVAMLVSDWFEFHIMQADKRLNEFIRFEVKKQ